MALGAFLYMHGSRIGTILERPEYAGQGQYLKWRDSDWIVTGWKDGVGLQIESFWKFHWLKGMRMNESEL